MYEVYKNDSGVKYPLTTHVVDGVNRGVSERFRMVADAGEVAVRELDAVVRGGRGRGNQRQRHRRHYHETEPAFQPVPVFLEKYHGCRLVLSVKKAGSAEAVPR